MISVGSDGVMQQKLWSIYLQNPGRMASNPSIQNNRVYVAYPLSDAFFSDHFRLENTIKMVENKCNSSKIGVPTVQCD